MSRRAYRRNKNGTAFEFMRRLQNWPAAWAMKVRPRKGALHLLNFRDGLNLMIREGTGDEAVMHELLFAGGYGRALSYISEHPDCAVLDLGEELPVDLPTGRRNEPTQSTIESKFPRWGLRRHLAAKCVPI
jgi:hypothetical protein